LSNPIVSAYSELADEYDGESNLYSCWGQITQQALASISLALKPHYRVVVEVGCGTGRDLLALASQSGPELQFIGLEPAANMRERARRRVSDYPNVRTLDGRFEQIPLESGSVDYLYSLLAFHWVTDLEQAVREIRRVLKPTGEMDLVFVGRHNGQEFIKATSPIFLRHMGLAALVKSAQMRKQLVRDAAAQLFSKEFGPAGLKVTESYETYYDTLEGHWSWWVRVQGHFASMPPDKKERCDQEVKQALAALATEQGIPYTAHLLHVSLRQD
jgi:ubiquinone/menaquinone biosynthesis C-methylase UbiE